MCSGYLNCLKNTSICVICSSACGPDRLGEMGMPALAASCSSAGQKQVNVAATLMLVLVLGPKAAAAGVRGCAVPCCGDSCADTAQRDPCSSCANHRQTRNAPSSSATKQPKITTAGTRSQCSSDSAAGDIILDSTADSRGRCCRPSCSSTCDGVLMWHNVEGNRGGVMCATVEAPVCVRTRSAGVQLQGLEFQQQTKCSLLTWVAGSSCRSC